MATNTGRTVTLLKNPLVPETNPRRRRRRKTHRNPSARGVVNQFTREFPPIEEVGGAFLGFATALQGPNMLKASRWMNVLWSAVFTAGGAIVLRSVKAGARLSNGFALGGTLATVGKAANIATNGQFGVPANLSVLPMPALPGLPANEAPPTEGLPNGGRNSVSPTGVMNVGAFRESQFHGGGVDTEDSLLT